MSRVSKVKRVVEGLRVQLGREVERMRGEVERLGLEVELLKGRVREMEERMREFKGEIIEVKEGVREGVLKKLVRLVKGG